MKWVCVRGRHRERFKYTHSHGFIQCFIRWWMLLGWCAKTEWRRGTPVSGLMSDAAQWKVPFLVSDSFSHCQGQPQPNPIHYSWFVTRPAAATLCGRKWIYFNQTLEVGHGWYSSSTSSSCRKGKVKTKHRKINFLSLVSLPPSPLLSHLSLFHSLCGNRAVCSVAPHWLNMSMSKWTQAFTLFPVPLHWLTDLH